MNQAARDVAAEVEPFFDGQLYRPGDRGYEEAREVWNSMHRTRPGLFARCAHTGDVQAVVRAAVRAGAQMSVRGGGHSLAGKAHIEGGVTIDLSAMRQVEVDAERRLVRAGGGCLLADVDEATHPHGLAVPMGTVSQTGLGGLALGGGLGWLTRRYGLTCDNFEALQVVLADGEVVEASARHHPDLLAGLRGGGGNFGVVTRFTLRAHPFGPDCRIGVALYRPDDAADALRGYASAAPGLPRNIGWHAAFKAHMPPLPYVPRRLVGERLLMLFCVWLGDAGDPAGADWCERLTGVGRPVLSTQTVMPFGTGMQRAIDPEFPDGLRYYSKGAFLPGLSEGSIRRLVDFWTGMPMGGEVELIQLGGALADVPRRESAFPMRDAPLWLNLMTHWSNPGRDTEYQERVSAAVAALAPYGASGVYVNALTAEEGGRVVDAYGGQARYTRLGRIKARYDPHNHWRANHNIRPAPTD